MDSIICSLIKSVSAARMKQILCFKYDDRTLGFLNDQQVRSADVNPGLEGMKMLVRTTCGVNVGIRPSVMVSKNKNRNYSMRNVPKIVLG